MNNKFIKTRIAGIELFIRKGRADRFLIMLHGIGSNYTSFDGLCKHLPEDIELIIWNAPGYGGSEPLSAEQPVAADYADKLHDVIESLGTDRFTLLGHSLGTLIATEYARNHAERIHALILMSCAQGYGMGVDSSLPDNARQRLSDLDTEGPIVFAQKRAPRLLHQPETKPHLTQAAIKAMSEINAQGYKQAVYMLAAGDLELSASQVHAPSLTIAANEDAITPSVQSLRCHDALCSANPAAKHSYIEIPDAGHLVHQEQPDAVASHIVGFCQWTADSAKKQSA